MKQKATVFLVLCSLLNIGVSQNSIFGSDFIAGVKFVGGNGCEGRLEITPDSTSEYGQACDNDIGSNEAMVICRQLGYVPEGAEIVDATRYGFSAFSVNVYRGFGYECTGAQARNASNINQCQRTGSSCKADDANYAIAIKCNGFMNSISESGIIAEVSFVGGMSSCEGRLDIRPDTTMSVYGQACDNDVGDNEAMVICRQLGCNPEGAEIVDATRYGFSDSSVNVYHGFGYACTDAQAMNASNINQCQRTESSCKADDVDYAIAIKCGSMTLSAQMLFIGLLTFGTFSVQLMI